MESMIAIFSEFGAQFIGFIWLPLLIWTVLAALFLIITPALNRLHALHHYHLRYALLLSLPAGLMALLLFEYAGSWLQTAGTIEGTLKLVYLSAPVEVFASEIESTLSWTAIIYATAAGVFIAGAILMTGSLFLQWLQLLAVKQKCRLKSIDSLPEVSNRNKQLALKTKYSISVAYLDDNVIPVTFGYFRPVIILPGSLKNDPEKLNLALRHELIHISERDFLSNSIINLIRVFFWYHPFVHILANQMIEYREMKCDSIVLADQKISKKRYASLLMELIPLPNLESRLSVNMAQESSNLKKRIQMISQNKQINQIPKRLSYTLFAVLLGCTVIAMACTDVQTDSIFNEEELDLMTDIDRTGERGYHQILIFAGEDGQADRHQGKLEQLNILKPEHIQSVEVLKGEEAINKYGARGEKGVIVIRTKTDEESYNRVLTVLGMEISEHPSPPSTDAESEQDDFFVVVEDMPILKGGLMSIAKEIRYPEEARNQGIQGRVYVQFIVNEQGEVEDPQIIRGIGGGADEEALRVVKQAKFKPGLQRGVPVRVQYSLPIVFRLQGSSDTESGTEQSSYHDQGETLNTLTVNSYGHNSDQGTGTVIEPQLINSERGIPETHGVIQRALKLNITDRGSSVIRGVLKDSETGEPVPGANIFIPGTNIGTVSDHEGSFSLRNISSDQEMVISHIRYKRVSTTL